MNILGHLWLTLFKPHLNLNDQRSLNKKKIPSYFFLKRSNVLSNKFWYFFSIKVLPCCQIDENILRSVALYGAIIFFFCLKWILVAISHKNKCTLKKNLKFVYIRIWVILCQLGFLVSLALIVFKCLNLKYKKTNNPATFAKNLRNITPKCSYCRLSPNLKFNIRVAVRLLWQIGLRKPLSTC